MWRGSGQHWPCFGCTRLRTEGRNRFGNFFTSQLGHPRRGCIGGVRQHGTASIRQLDPDRIHRLVHRLPGGERQRLRTHGGRNRGCSKRFTEPLASSVVVVVRPVTGSPWPGRSSVIPGASREWSQDPLEGGAPILTAGRRTEPPLETCRLRNGWFVVSPCSRRRATLDPDGGARWPATDSLSARPVPADAAGSPVLLCQHDSEVDVRNGAGRTSPVARAGSACLAGVRRRRGR
jgi:hypothetical protein